MPGLRRHGSHFGNYATQIISRVPHRYDRDVTRCFLFFCLCSRQMLEHGGSSAAGDVILLVTSGTASADQIQAAMALATKKSVHISVIAFAYGSPIGSLRNLQSLTEATSGLMTTIASKGVGYMSHISMLIELGDALLSALQFHQKSESQDLPVLVRQRP